VSDRTELEEALGMTPACVPVERLAEHLTEREQQHVDSCARCQSELALWREFEESRRAPDEGAAVSWIVAELGRRNQRVPARKTRPAFGWLTAPVWRWTTAIAAVALVTTGVYLLQDREPEIREISRVPQTYRTGGLEVRIPVGDIAAPPNAIEWVARDGAVGYDVAVFEVDGTPLWRQTSSISRVELPGSVVRQFVPGKTILWEVRARNAANQVVAESGMHRFRVTIAGSSPKD